MIQLFSYLFNYLLELPLEVLIGFIVLGVLLLLAMGLNAYFNS